MVPVLPTSLPVPPTPATGPGVTPNAAAPAPNTPALTSHATAPTPGPDPSQAAINATVADMKLAPDVHSFYTVGAEEVPVTKPHEVKSPMEMNNLFEDLPKFLGQEGGPSNPAGLLAAQTQVIQVTLGWSLIGQMASKAASGMQALFNNQV